MKKISSPAVFFGSGPVASQSLEMLAKYCELELVITKPSTESIMRSSTPEGTKLVCVSSKSELDELLDNNQLKSTYGILIDFGIIVSKKVIDRFPLGIINSHFSLLPQLRGADPITFSILSGQKTTGVSLMLLDVNMDEGPILAQSPLDIGANDTSESLTSNLIDLSDSLLKETLPQYLNGSIIPVDQASASELMGINPNPTYSQKLTKEMGLLDWSKPAKVLEREIRAYHSWPKSFAKLGKVDVIVRYATVTKESGKPGTYKFDKKSLTIFCGSDALNIISIQPAGKKEMPISAFLAGYSSSLVKL